MSFNGKVFICSCRQELRNKDDVDRHDKKWFDLGHTKQCQFPDCDKVSPQTFNAKRHWKTHLPAELRKHFCRKCSASYAKKQHLKKHEAADTCLYNRQRCQTKSEDDTGTSVLPANALQNDRSIAIANVAELEPTSPKDLSNQTSLHSDFLNERVLPISEWTDFMFADLGFISAADAPCEQPQRSFGYASFDSLPTTTLQNLGPLPTLGHCFDMVLSYDNPRVNCGNHYGDPQVHSCEDGVPVALAYAKWHSATSDAGAVHLRWEKAVRTRSMKKIDKTISKIGSPYRKDKARLQAASATKDEGKTTRLSIRSGLRSQSLRK
jgi:hypothetical protein